MVDMKELIIRFWEGSEEFNSDIFFSNFTPKLYEKLALHGCLEIDDYIECLRKYYDLDILDKFV